MAFHINYTRLYDDLPAWPHKIKTKKPLHLVLFTAAHTHTPCKRRNRVRAAASAPPPPVNPPRGKHFWPLDSHLLQPISFEKGAATFYVPNHRQAQSHTNQQKLSLNKTLNKKTLLMLQNHQGCEFAAAATAAVSIVRITKQAVKKPRK